MRKNNHIKPYGRVLLKLTGELLGGKRGENFDFDAIDSIAQEIHAIHSSQRIQLAIVLGGGNLFRGREVADTSVDRASADYIGMLGTIMNALALQEALERNGTPTRVLSAIPMQSVCEPYIRRKTIRHLEKGRVVILAGGVGSPFFTTDSAAALRACELRCDVLLKGSTVDGIYDSDPRFNKNAKLYKTLTYQMALEKKLGVMDNTAFALCQREQVPIVVFNLENLQNIAKIIKGEEIGTIVS